LPSNNFSFVPSLPLAFAFESELKPHRKEKEGGEEVDGDVESGSASLKIFVSGEFGGRFKIASRRHPRPPLGWLTGHPRGLGHPLIWLGVATCHPYKRLGVARPPHESDLKLCPTRWTDFVFIYYFNIFIFFIKSDTCHHFIGADVDTNGIRQVL
jgi:hypothetical protein